MRIGTRRLRACLSLVRNACAPRAALDAAASRKSSGSPTCSGRRAIGTCSSRETLPPLAAVVRAATRDCRRDCERLRARAEARRRAARDAAREAVALAALPAAAAAGGRLCATPRFGAATPSATPTKPDAPAAAPTRSPRTLLERRHRKLADARHDARARGSPEERHAARIAAKRLRYVAEFFAPLFPRKRAQDLSSRRWPRCRTCWAPATTRRRRSSSPSESPERRRRGGAARVRGWAARAARARSSRSLRTAWRRFARARSRSGRDSRRALDARIRGNRPPDREGDYAREEPKLREALLNAQCELSAVAARPDAARHLRRRRRRPRRDGEQLNEWMDPRHIRVVAFGPPHRDELARPPAWRYWRALPPQGRDRHLHERLVQRDARRARCAARSSDDELDAQLDAIRQHERMLTDEGLVLLKFWIHLSKTRSEEAPARARTRPAHALARHARRLGRIADLQQVARPVGARAARDVDRRGAVVRRRRAPTSATGT